MLTQILNLTKLLVIHQSNALNPRALKSVLNEATKPLKKDKSLTFEYFEKNQKPSFLIYKGKKRPDRFKIILNAHLDVIAGKSEQFKPFENKGRLFGRGAADMKGAAAVEILVFKEIAQKIDYPLALELVTDEEIGGFNCTKYQIDNGVRADFVIAGEPTSFGINNKAKGIIWIKIDITGKSAHGAYPWEGKNALLIAKKIIDKIYKIYPLPKKETWKTTFNLSRIETINRTFNKVPDEASLFFDIRYIPEEFKELPFEKGRKFFERKIRKITGNLGKVQTILFEPPQLTSRKNFFILRLKETVKKITGETTELVAKHGGSDIRHFNKVGCDGITFGPIGGGIHGDNEWVDILSLEKYYLILKDFLLNI